LESLPENRPAQVKHPVFNERVQWFADETTPSSDLTSQSKRNFYRSTRLTEAAVKTRSQQRRKASCKKRRSI
jgi:hypothetical protein